jgi:hypothetical protein
MIGEESSQVGCVGGEYHGRAGIDGVRGHNRINATGYSSNASALHAVAEMPSSPSYGLRCVHGVESPDHVVDRGIIRSTGDRFREDDRRNEGLPTILKELTQDPTEFLVARRLIDHTRVEDDNRLAHVVIVSRILEARRWARRFVCSDAGSPTSSSSR